MDLFKDSKMKKILLILFLLILGIVAFSFLAKDKLGSQTFVSEFQICVSHPNTGCVSYYLKTDWKVKAVVFREVTFQVLNADNSPNNNFEIVADHHTLLKTLSGFQEGYYDNNNFVVYPENNSSNEVSKGDLSVNLVSSTHGPLTRTIFWPNPQTFIYVLTVSSNGVRKQKKGHKLQEPDVIFQD